MHIGFRTSQGRGEYELVGSLSGYAAADLEGWTFSIRWPDGVVRDTGLWLDGSLSGKARLRSLQSPPVQIGKILSDMLLLPDNTRSRESLGTGDQILREKAYRISMFGFGPNTEFAPLIDAVTVDPTFVEVGNASGSDVIGVKSRWDRIAEVIARVGELPAALAEQVNSYAAFIDSGDPSEPRVRRIISGIQLAVQHELSNGQSNQDPLPQLEQMLNIWPRLDLQLPEPSAIAEEAPGIKLRAAHEYRLAKIRGRGARRFAKTVTWAYGYRCMFCGGKFGGVADVRSGVEAAHILAWSSYDLDVVQNGMSLCGLHHWAFDAGLIVPVYSGQQIELRLTKLAGFLDLDARTRIGTDRFVVPNHWLPTEMSAWPDRHYLQKLYDDLAIDLLDD